MAVTTKLDEIVNLAIDGITKRGRGFVLDLANEVDEQGRHLKVEIVERLAPADEWEKPADLRRHTVHDAESFVAFVNRYANPDKALVFIDADAAVLIIDETVDRGDRERVIWPMTFSDDYREWKGIMGKSLTHKDLLQHLIAHEHNLASRSMELVQAMRTMKATTTVKHDSDLQEDSTSIGMMIESKGGEEIKKFPKAITVTFPVLDADVLEQVNHVTATVRLDITLPTEPKQPPMFTLICSQWRQLGMKRLADERACLAEQLKGYCVLFGTPNHEPRLIGRKPPATNQFAR